ncbi:MAG: HlyD family efflux transporter periplasmic adaptor subunit [Planctomycetota bacterium]|nr:MAG: HlyD family efflux transporter periplasmic adaptor subunit [Planctomycetota bacterium]
MLKKKWVLYTGAGLGFLLLILHSMGVFYSKISPGYLEVEHIVPRVKGEQKVVWRTITPVHRALGTISSAKEISISSQVRGVVEGVYFKEGDEVRRGDLLVKINDEEFRTRLEQSRKGLEIARASQRQAIQMLVVAQAGYARSESDKEAAQAAVLQAQQRQKAAEAAWREAKNKLERDKALRQKRMLSEEELERSRVFYQQAESNYNQAKQGVKIARSRLEGVLQLLKSAKAAVDQARIGVEIAKASVEQAKQIVKEAEIALQYTLIRAPDDGVLVRKWIEPGNLAWPGKVLLQIHKPKILKLEGEVPESLRPRIALGKKFWVHVSSIGYKELAELVEIIPSADPRSRTFRVKLLLPYRKKLYPGMFGTFLIPLPVRKAILVDRRSIERVGQFESVYVKQRDREGREYWIRRWITTGASYGELVEVLSGLGVEERVAILR